MFDHRLEIPQKISVSYFAFLSLMLMYLVYIFVRTFDYRPESRLVPLLVIPVFFILLVVEFLAPFTPEKYKPEREDMTGYSDSFDTDQVDSAVEDASATIEDRRSPLKVSAWVVLLAVLIIVLGFLLGSVLFLLLFLIHEGDFSYAMAGGYAGILFLFLYVVFVLILDTPLFGGVLFGEPMRVVIIE